MTDLKQVKQAVERNMEEAEALARDIWAYAELPYCEEKSAGALCEALKREGFTVEAPVAGIPTCFIATFSCGSGKPAVGLLAEFDALDGLSQRAACPVQEPVARGGPWLRSQSAGGRMLCSSCGNPGLLRAGGAQRQGGVLWLPGRGRSGGQTVYGPGRLL